MSRILPILGLIVMLLAHGSQAQITTEVTKVGTTSAQFLKIGVGARPVAMGGAFVAVANDATAIYWNPAGIATLHKSELLLVHTQWLVDTKFDFAGLVVPLGGFGVLGASITSVSMTEMKVRTVFEPEGTGEMFGASDLALGMSFARNLTDRFSIGFNAKYIHQNIWHMTAWSIAFDIGTLFTTQFNDMKIGMSISNFGPKMNLKGIDTLILVDIAPEKYGSNDRLNAHLDTGSWSLPLIFRVGLAMDVFKGEKSRMTLGMDALHPNDNTECLNLGAEYVFQNWMSLRFGYKSLFRQDSEESLTAGIGLESHLRGGIVLYIDYAYADFGRLQNAQRFSLGIRF